MSGNVGFAQRERSAQRNAGLHNGTRGNRWRLAYTVFSPIIILIGAGVWNGNMFGSDGGHAPLQIPQGGSLVTGIPFSSNNRTSLSAAALVFSSACGCNSIDTFTAGKSTSNVSTCQQASRMTAANHPQNHCASVVIGDTQMSRSWMTVPSSKSFENFRCCSLLMYLQDLYFFSSRIAFSARSFALAVSREISSNSCFCKATSLLLLPDCKICEKNSPATPAITDQVQIGCNMGCIFDEKTSSPVNPMRTDATKNDSARSHQPIIDSRRSLYFCLAGFSWPVRIALWIYVVVMIFQRIQARKDRKQRRVVEEFLMNHRKKD